LTRSSHELQIFPELLSAILPALIPAFCGLSWRLALGNNHRAVSASLDASSEPQPELSGFQGNGVC
jgi:hypothetical protein